MSTICILIVCFIRSLYIQLSTLFKSGTKQQLILDLSSVPLSWRNPNTLARSDNKEPAKCWACQMF